MQKLRSLKDGWMMSLRKLTILKHQSQKIGMMKRMVHGSHLRLITQSVRQQNPAYKGKWHASLIDNLNYKGIWKQEQIDNPDYFELEEPDFEPVAAIGIEILTIQNGILFDNILIVADEKVAESYRETTWKPKFEVEKEKQKSEDEATRVSDGPAGFQKKAFETLQGR